MRMRQIAFLIVLPIIFMHLIHTDPPPPPPLPGELASQTIEQLLQLFNKGGANNLNTKMMSLFTTTVAKKSLTVAPKATITTQTSAPTTTAGSTQSVLSMLNNPKLSDTAKANLIFTTHTNADGSARKVTAKTQYAISPAVSALNKSFMSNFTGSNEVTLPDLTFSNAATTQAYKEFAQALVAVPSFLSIFKKIHTLALHEIYLYLISMYATLNLMNINDFKSYVILENTFGLNKKTLIISHLVNLIEAQLTQTIQGIMPGMPKEVAIRGGMTVLNNQGASNLDMLLLDMEKTVLATIGMNPLSAEQVNLIIKTLTKDSNAQLIANNQDIDQQEYQDALTVMKKSQEKFVQELTTAQADALIEALFTISSGASSAQKIATMQNIIKTLNDPAQALIVSAQDLYLFKDVVEQIAYGIPFKTIEEAFTSISKKLTSGGSESLSSSESACLDSIISYILKQSESNLGSTIEYCFGKLAALNSQHQTLMLSQKIDLQQITSSLISDGTALITKLKKTDRLIVAQACTVFSKNQPPELPKSTDLYAALGKKLQDDNVNNASLTSQENTLLLQVCKYLAAFTPTETQYTADDQAILTEIFSLVDATDLDQNPFKDLSENKRSAAFQALKKLDAITYTRFMVHDTQAAIFEGVIQEDEAAIEDILLSLDISSYESLANFYEYRKTKPTASFAESDAYFKSKNFSPSALCKMIFLASTQADKVSYFDIITSLAKKQVGDQSVVQQIIQKLSPETSALYKGIAEKFKVIGFDFKQLSEQERKALLAVFVPLSNALKETIDPQGDPALSQLLENTGILVGETHSFNTTKGSFLWALKKYLTFFNLYTASLENYVNNSYLGFVTFSNDAKLVSQALKNSAIQTLNPPLFFYDQATLRSIKLLPQLSKLIEGTERIPYPTFAVEQALNETTINPVDGIEYANTVSMGQGTFTYKKFFFIDTAQSTSASATTTQNSFLEELTGERAQKITWLKKISIPTSNNKNLTIKNYDHMYLATTPPDDASGFYMNIPLFDRDVTDPNKLQIRLFEQKIIAQPEWLNHSGFEKNTPGVATLVRGCLGDFVALLDLGIFDPCLTVIFKSALALSTDKDSINDLKQRDASFVTQTTNCGTYLQNKTTELQKRQQVTTTNNFKQPNAGGTIPMPGVS